MISVEEIDAWLLTRIANVYLRPEMYGGSLDGVDAHLLDLHEFWAVIHNCDCDFLQVWNEVATEEGCSSVQRFPQLICQRAAQAGPSNHLRYIVNCWRKIDERLAICVPVEPVRAELLAAGIDAKQLLF